jgi:hypothetical protein
MPAAAPARNGHEFLGFRFPAHVLGVNRLDGSHSPTVRARQERDEVADDADEPHHCKEGERRHPDCADLPRLAEL